jgi:hypothetical protein
MDGTNEWTNEWKHKDVHRRAPWSPESFGKVAVNTANFFVAFDFVEPIQGVTNLPQITARFRHFVKGCSSTALQPAQCVDSERRSCQSAAKVQFGHRQRIFAGDVTWW